MEETKDEEKNDDPPDPPLTLLPPLPAQSEVGGLGLVFGGRGRARWWGEVGESPFCVLFFYPSLFSPSISSTSTVSGPVKRAMAVKGVFLSDDQTSACDVM